MHIRQVVTEEGLVERVKHLQRAIEGETLQSFAEGKTSGNEGWKALLSLFNANSRDELVTLLGFSKAEVAARVAEAIENLKISKSSSQEVVGERIHEPVVSFAEPERQDSSDDDDDEGGGDKTPSEISASVASDARVEGESTTTVPSLFGEDDGLGTPQDTGADFFNTVGVAQDDGGSHAVHIPHTNYGLDSSVAATIGSGPSSVTSETLKSNTFRIYPTDESETDRLVTKALVLGDFESAVSLCLSSDRYADAILLAARGGEDLLRRTQKSYFERRTIALPYLRLFQSIVTNDLADIVQNADLQEWQEIFVVLCTFAGTEDFSALAEQLGARLEFQFTVAKNSEDPDGLAQAGAFRKNATLTYLASARLERLTNIWIEELVEEEKTLVEDEGGLAGSYYSAHAHALQSFIEKVTVFRSATRYKDGDLVATTSAVVDATAATTYKLANLYDRYFEYADFLSTQGLVKEAFTFIQLVPGDYKGSDSNDLSAERERIIAATGSAPTANTSQTVPKAVPATSQARPLPPNLGRYPTGQPPAPSIAPTGFYQPMAPAPTAQYVPPSANTYVPLAPAGTHYAPDNLSYPSAASLTQPPHLRGPIGVPPPRPTNGSPAVPPPPPPKRSDNGGWNDAPIVSRTPVSANTGKAIQITSPFPHATSSPTGSPRLASGQAPLPPPPRPGSVTGRQSVPPPPPQGHRPLAPPISSHAPPPHARPPSANMTAPPRQPTPSQYAPPPAGGPGPGPTPLPSQLARPPPPNQGPYVRATPPPAGYAPSGPYAPPQQQQNPGPYAPPQGQPGPYAPPPGTAGHYAPPAGVGVAPPAPGPSGPPRAPGTSGATGAPTKAQPPPPKYRMCSSVQIFFDCSCLRASAIAPGDRTHIPEYAQSAYQIINDHLERLKQSVPVGYPLHHCTCALN